MAAPRATLRLGTRRSPLALHQARMARAAIAAVDPGLPVELVEIVSDGDTDPRELREIGERGIFAHALERRLVDGDIDAAVHSSKDLAIVDAPGLVLAAWLERADPRDALVAAGCDLADLPAGARLATGSARRGALLRTFRGDLEPVGVRGNVTTRIARARERGDAGCILAMAGLTRLGLTSTDIDVRPLAVEQFVPEAGQGAVVVQARARVCERTGLDWSALDHVATRRTAQLERRLARLLGGGCEQPVGVHAQLDSGRVLAFAAPAPDAPGTHVVHDVLGLELGTLVSVTAPDDVDEAAAWSARRLAPTIAEQLGLQLAEAPA